MKNHKMKKEINIYKKDSNGLFSGKYKSVEFESKKFKKEKHKKNINKED